MLPFMCHAQTIRVIPLTTQEQERLADIQKQKQELKTRQEVYNLFSDSFDVYLRKKYNVNGGKWMMDFSEDGKYIVLSDDWAGYAPSLTCPSN
ncbi:MAG TPA: hypothetical protein VGF75_06485 [Candidatus Saccharimonadales bacterium]|jgi:hypothetical protein